MALQTDNPTIDDAVEERECGYCEGTGLTHEPRRTGCMTDNGAGGYEIMDTGPHHCSNCGGSGIVRPPTQWELELAQRQERNNLILGLAVCVLFYGPIGFGIYWFCFR